MEWNSLSVDLFPEYYNLSLLQGEGEQTYRRARSILHVSVTFKKRYPVSTNSTSLGLKLTSAGCCCAI